MHRNRTDRLARNKTRVHKLVLVGDGGVGKTALRRTYMGESFDTNYLSTIGADFSVKTITNGSLTLKFQMWDMSGQQHFEPVRQMFYGGTEGVVFVFDITRLDTLENFPYWLEEIKRHNPNPAQIVIFGNKSDRREEAFQNLPNKLEFDWGQPKKISVFYTSALTGENVQEGFEHLFNLLSAPQNQQEEVPSSNNRSPLRT